jgi:26S proteasome regulatory subunit N2
MKPFLPESNKEVVNHFPNGVGLIYAGTNDKGITDQINAITKHAEHSKNEVVMHGACLGLGLNSFASQDNVVGERLKDFMNISSSVIGEAAALSIGLVYAGSSNDLILSELINFAQ